MGSAVANYSPRRGSSERFQDRDWEGHGGTLDPLKPQLRSKTVEDCANRAEDRPDLGIPEVQTVDTCPDEHMQESLPAVPSWPAKLYSPSASGLQTTL